MENVALIVIALVVTAFIVRKLVAIKRNPCCGCDMAVAAGKCTHCCGESLPTKESKCGGGSYTGGTSKNV
jgi:hypothetical protein